MGSLETAVELVESWDSKAANFSSIWRSAILDSMVWSIASTLVLRAAMVAFCCSKRAVNFSCCWSRRAVNLSSSVEICAAICAKDVDICAESC